MKYYVIKDFQIGTIEARQGLSSDRIGKDLFTELPDARYRLIEMLEERRMKLQSELLHVEAQIYELSELQKADSTRFADAWVKASEEASVRKL